MDRETLAVSELMVLCPVPAALPPGPGATQILDSGAVSRCQSAPSRRAGHGSFRPLLARVVRETAGVLSAR